MVPDSIELILIALKFHIEQFMANRAGKAQQAKGVNYHIPGVNKENFNNVTSNAGQQSKPQPGSQ